MANELKNAVVLLDLPSMVLYAKAAASYQARVVITEPDTTADHAVRTRLADAVIANPDYLVQRAVSVLATDPSVNGVGSDPAAMDQTVILGSMAKAWTPLAKLLFPEGGTQA